MNKNTVNSVENMCRTCMTEFPKTKRKIDNKKQSILEVPTGSKNKTSIMELLQLVQPQIRIEIEDHLPTLMCSDCVRKLLISHEFIEMYKNVDEKFRKMLEEINIDCKYEFNDLEEPLKIVDEKDLTVEMVEKDEIHEIAKFELEIEQVNLEDLEKEEENENDWPKFEDELLQEMSEQENDKEPVFINPYSDASDNEWTPIGNRKKDSPKKTITRKQKSGKINDRTTNSNSAKKTKRKQNTEELPLPVENEDGRVQCQQCDTVLENIKLWHEHVLQHQPKETHKRKYVKKSDKIKNDQSDQKEYECEDCGKGFSSSTYFRIHKRIHSVEQPFLCTECGKGFKVNSSLYTHMLRHKGVKKYQCLHCPKKFVCSSGLYGHMLVHTNKKSFVCDICGSAFRMGYELKKHERCHNGIKNFQCEYCDKKFITREKQLRHIRTHTGEKPYRCKYCGRAFAQSNDCVKHLKQHLGDNVYQCDLCPLRFPLARDLRAHFATHRDDDEETRACNLKARTDDERNLQIKFGLKNSSNLINSKYFYLELKITNLMKNSLDPPERQCIMESSFRATKIASMALNKRQYGNDEKLRMQSTLTDSNAERKIYSSSSFSEADNSFIDTRYTPHNTVSNSNIDCLDDSTSNSCDSYITDVEIPIISTSDSQITDIESPMTLKSPLKKGLKRKRNENNCLRSINKKLRNSGKAYIIGSTGNKVRKERKMEPPCTEKCKLKCFKNFTEEERMVFFHSYWELGEIQKQRIFIQSSMEIIQPAYRYVREGGTRKKRDNNNAFFFYRNGEKVRVCKLFYKNTLNITNRTIRTVQQKRNKLPNVLLEDDLRGRHGKQKKIDEVLRQGVNSFINKIPRIESQYTRASTSKHFIDGSKTIADIHRDYMADCKVINVPFVNYVMFYRIFTEDYNISFFSPKKDLCETCCAYDNAEGEEKKKLENYYKQHTVEKELSIKEKKYDKEEANATVVVCDLQPVMQIPKGDDSVFYYKSKLNVYNLAIYDLKSNECECFIWDESNGHRGVNELGSCLLQFLKKRAGLEKEDFIFYSDNCVGLQRNKSMVALYIYAISNLNINSITHKYLIKGHTQNEGDSVHSLIERQVKRQLKAGPMYTPELFISAVRAAKKTTKPFNVTEMCFEDFFDIKALATEMELQNMAQLNISTVVALRFERNSPNTVFFKTSYNDKEFKAVDNITKKKYLKDIKLTRAYYTKPKIAENKKKELLELLQKNHIPKYYKHFYEQL